MELRWTAEGGAVAAGEWVGDVDYGAAGEVFVTVGEGIIGGERRDEATGEYEDKDDDDDWGLKEGGMDGKHLGRDMRRVVKCDGIW